MNTHRKVHSQGSIPFSWEDKPGVSKIKHKECPIDRRLNLTSSHDLDKSLVKIPIPLPPCPLQTPQRSSSTKLSLGRRWWREDPFLAAYKECTKSKMSSGKLGIESKASNGSLTRKSKLIFSCKNSCDATHDNLVRLTNLSPLPKHTIRVPTPTTHWKEIL
ncbi:hypothetical protein CFOL_v3_12551 [Cephalotus follicularis]|uniref:DUF688 domain-containing protein n=1 Tax=Cephalotus follicularis TaxID=3775 RepID=A0A1Q3BLZ2_CEPFO|nr:hypothetical protein CFOL_v3_12551 [Cephalotus follicularis]